MCCQRAQPLHPVHRVPLECAPFLLRTVPPRCRCGLRNRPSDAGARRGTANADSRSRFVRCIPGRPAEAREADGIRRFRTNALYGHDRYPEDLSADRSALVRSCGLQHWLFQRAEDLGVGDESRRIRGGQRAVMAARRSSSAQTPRRSGKCS